MTWRTCCTKGSREKSKSGPLHTSGTRFPKDAAPEQQPVGQASGRRPQSRPPVQHHQGGEHCINALSSTTGGSTHTRVVHGRRRRRGSTLERAPPQQEERGTHVAGHLPGFGRVAVLRGDRRAGRHTRQGQPPGHRAERANGDPSATRGCSTTTSAAGTRSSTRAVHPFRGHTVSSKVPGEPGLGVDAASYTNLAALATGTTRRQDPAGCSAGRCGGHSSTGKTKTTPATDPAVLRGHR